MSLVVKDTILKAIHNGGTAGAHKFNVVKDTILKAIHNKWSLNKIMVFVVKDTILKAIHNWWCNRAANTRLLKIQF